MHSATTRTVVLLIVSGCILASPLSSGLTEGSQRIDWNSRAQMPISVQKEPIDLPTAGWVDPRILGGRLLDFTTPRKGEPLNVIVSGNSDSYVLTDAGFSNYAKSLGFSSECLGLHFGAIHQADLGDGNHRQDEQVLARQYYFPGPGGPILGTCWESLAGGNHFRAWRQNGTQANSGAWFLGVSKEENSGKHHEIIPNGYNIGRDFLVGRATSPTHWNSIWWQAEVEWVEGLLEPGNHGVNHGIKQDGLVAVLTVLRI